MFVERAEGKWYYILEDGWAPKDAWDWREYATAYGPFRTQDLAQEHLSLNHANPGGSSTVTFRDEKHEEDEVLRELLDGATFRKWGQGIPSLIFPFDKS